MEEIEVHVDSYSNEKADVVHTVSSRSRNPSQPQINRYAFLLLCSTTLFMGFMFGYFIGPLIERSDYTYSTITISSSSSNPSYDTTTSTSSTMTASSLTDTPVIKFYNNYTISRPYTQDYPWDNIVEPYRVTYFYVDNPIPSSLLTKSSNSHSKSRPAYAYNWYISGWHKDTGDSISTIFTDIPGTKLVISVELTYTDSNTNEQTVLSKSSIEVIIKYVRREVRALFDRDREAFFNAVAIMQRVPTHTGQKLYGKDYRSKDFMNRIHLYYGGSQSCDHWHQGPGFVTSHVTFELMYEKSLQSINPSVTIPYWDFTLESTFYTPSTFRNSGVFTESWFGDARCNNTYHTATSGRFQFVPTMQNAQNFSMLVSPFGLLRSPWNVDPTPYMTRSDQIFGVENNLKPSGCAEYYKTVLKKDWKNLAIQLNSNAHGHIHELLGGSWNTKLKVNLPSSDVGMSSAYEFLHATEAYSKILWRFGFLECPTPSARCSINSPTARGMSDDKSCQCQCVDFKAKGLKYTDVLQAGSIIKGLVFYDKSGNAISSWVDKVTKLPYETLPGYSYEETQQMYADVLNVLCNPGHIGDMFQATSTNDITFWVLHPTLDRLWHLMRLNFYYKLIDFDETWNDEEITCDGHHSYGTTPFKNIFDSNDRVYTNMELYDLLNPSLDSFPYIYDHFRWSHCSFLGKLLYPVLCILLCYVMS